jgi:hypothetical protein
LKFCSPRLQPVSRPKALDGEGPHPETQDANHRLRSMP